MRGSGPRGAGVSSPAAALVSTAAVALPDYVASLAWRPDGGMLAAACADGSVHELLPDGGSAPTGHHAGGACAVAYAPDGTLASAGEDGRVAIGPVPGRPAGAGWVELLAWSPDGARLASAVGRRIQIWSPDGELVAESPELAATVECLAWSPDGLVLAAGGHGGASFLDRAAEPVRRLQWTGVVLAAAYSPDGARLACGMQDLSVWVWDVRTETAVTMDGYARKVRELSWASDGVRLATGGGAVPVVWDVGASSQVELHGGHERPVVWVGFRPGGDWLATAGEDGLAIVWSGSSPLTGATIGEPASACAWSPDGTRLALAGQSGRVAVFALT